MNPVVLVRSKRFGDERGWFSESYNCKRFGELGIFGNFVQDNHSLSKPAGTLRGLHFQTPPHGQAKLVRCIAGAIYDVAVDVRRGSPTYGHYAGAELSAHNGLQLHIPVGFAHGFLTLLPDTEVVYKVTDYYAPDNDGGLRWDDPDIAIQWPMPPHLPPTLSGKDAKLGFLKDFDSPFPYDGHPLQAIAL